LEQCTVCLGTVYSSSEDSVQSHWGQGTVHPGTGYIDRANYSGICQLAAVFGRNNTLYQEVANVFLVFSSVCLM